MGQQSLDAFRVKNRFHSVFRNKQACKGFKLWPRDNGSAKGLNALNFHLGVVADAVAGFFELYSLMNARVMSMASAA